eukprot:4651247-Pyramimonas_sp.AAC.1
MPAHVILAMPSLYHASHGLFVPCCPWSGIVPSRMSSAFGRGSVPSNLVEFWSNQLRARRMNGVCLKCMVPARGGGAGVGAGCHESGAGCEKKGQRT